MLPAVLGLLSAAPALLAAATDVYRAVTGDEVPEAARSAPQTMAAAIDRLPADQRDAVVARLLEHREALDREWTTRFVAMSDGDAETLRASARPQIALQAMAVIALFSRLLVGLGIVTVTQWAVLLLCEAMGWQAPTTDIWAMLAKAQPVAEMIWAPLLASFGACVVIVKAYFGARERDKAQEYELRAGRPLAASAAVVEAAAGLGARFGRLFGR